MAYDFPNAPAVNDIYTSGGMSWQWTGSAWVQIPATASSALNVVQGPGASADNAIVRFDGTSGALIQNSGVIVSDGNSISGLTGVATTGTVAADAVTAGGNISSTSGSMSAAGYVDCGATYDFRKGGVTAWIKQGHFVYVNGGINTATPILVSTLPGGYFGFAPVCYSNVSEGHIAGPAFASTAATPGTLQGSGTTTAGAQYYCIGRAATGTQYAYQQYVSASPPYDMGDGEIPLFLYALMENGTGKVLGAYEAQDPPWANNGPTSIRADFTDENGKSYRRIKDVKRTKGFRRMSPQERVIAFAEAPFIDVEITLAYKNSDMALIPHPFIADPNFLAGKATPVLLDPMSPIMPALSVWQAQGQSVLDFIHKDGQPGALVIGNTPLKRAGPHGLKIVSAKWR